MSEKMGVSPEHLINCNIVNVWKTKLNNRVYFNGVIFYAWKV